jgi:hypothetical protein
MGGPDGFFNKALVQTGKIKRANESQQASATEPSMSVMGEEERKRKQLYSTSTGGRSLLGG